MKRLFITKHTFTTIVVCFLLSACSPEVGSEKWCVQMEETPKGDWSANMAADYAKHCLFKIDVEQE